MKLGEWEGSGNASGPKTKMHLVLWMEARRQEPCLDTFGFILYYASGAFFTSMNIRTLPNSDLQMFPARHTDSAH